MESPVRNSKDTIFHTLGSTSSNIESHNRNSQLRAGFERREDRPSQSFLVTLVQLDILESRFGSITDPSTPEIDQIVKATQLSFRDVHAWFHRKRVDQQKHQPESGGEGESLMIHDSSLMLATSATRNLVPLAHERSQILSGGLSTGSIAQKMPANMGKWNGPTSLNEVPLKRLREMMIPATSRQGSNPTFHLYCPSCADSLTKWGAWILHQEVVHFPRTLFVCWLDRGIELCGEAFHTRDGMRSHYMQVHKVPIGGYLERSIDGIFHNRCGFDFCKKELPSWEESMDHIFYHVAKESKCENWTHRYTNDHEQKLAAQIQLLVEETTRAPQQHSQVKSLPEAREQSGTVVDGDWYASPEMNSGERASNLSERSHDAWKGLHNSRFGSRSMSPRSRSYYDS